MRAVFIALVLSVAIIQVCCDGTHGPFSPPHSHDLNGKSDKGGVAPIRRNKRQTGLEPFRNKRQSEEGEVISFAVTAADLDVPQLKRSDPVQIPTQDYYNVERYVKFVYPQPKLEVDGRRNEIEHTLGTIIGGIAEIKEVMPYGYTPSTRNKSIIMALVQYTSSVQVIDLSGYNRTSALPLIENGDTVFQEFIDGT